MPRAEYPPPFFFVSQKRGPYSTNCLEIAAKRESQGLEFWQKAQKRALSHRSSKAAQKRLSERPLPRELQQVFASLDLLEDNTGAMKTSLHKSKYSSTILLAAGGVYDTGVLGLMAPAAFF
jgi:hypothetical protein